MTINITVLVILILTTLAGISNAIMDVLDFHFYNSIFRFKKWWDPKRTWLNKWKLDKSSNGDFPQPVVKRTFKVFKWKITYCLTSWCYLFTYNPQYVERFPYSSTVLVFLTDPWHLFKWITFTCLELSLMVAFLGTKLYGYLWYWLLMVIGVLTLKIVRGRGFSLFFDKLLIDKKKK